MAARELEQLEDLEDLEELAGGRPRRCRGAHALDGGRHRKGDRRRVHAAARPCAAGGDVWLYPLALSANETDSSSKMHNRNVGDVLALLAEKGFAHPLVTPATRFAAYETLDDGAEAMLRVLDRFGGLAAADAGNLAAFQKACDGYLGQGKTYPSLAARVAALGQALKVTA